MKSKILYKVAIGFLFLSLVFSCDKIEDAEIGGTNLEDMSGDWYVELLVDGSDIYGIGHSLISTYNTATDDGTEIWIDDLHHIWDFKVKSSVNTDSMTFSGTDLPNNVDGYDINVTISNGAIVKDGATTSGGNTSDSITFDAVFSDDPTTTYQLVGYKRTGFAEDEH